MFMLVDARRRRTAGRAAAIDAKFAVAKIVDEHEQDVWPRRRQRLCLRARPLDAGSERGGCSKRRATEQDGAAIERRHGIHLVPIVLSRHDPPLNAL
jgi:hypothetical protein